MGIFLDTIEDRDERYGQFIDVVSRVQWTGPGGIEPTYPLLIECPICGDLKLSKEDLDQHIVANHANKHVYVRANNNIVRGLVYSKEPLEILQVVLLGINHARLTIEKTGFPPETIEISEGISSIPNIKDFVSGEIHLRIEYENESREFTILLGTMPEFNNDSVDQNALKYLFIPLNNYQVPSFGDFSDLYPMFSKNYIEFRYAQGFHDYALGFYMVQKDKVGKVHLESALNLLAPFKTKAAVTAQRVLALRMNFFKLILSCGPSSRFSVAKLFFNQPKGESGKEIELTSPKWSPQEYGIYIDKFTELFLDALNTYYNGDYRMLDELCQQIEILLPEIDRNNRDKLTLLYARTAKKRNDEINYKRFYQMLLYHPDFGEEAKELLK